MAEPHPEMAAAFQRWRLADLASHYANNCPDEVMDDLVNRGFDALKQAASLPATTASDVLLKVFMLAVVELEPKKGEPPMTPRDPFKCEIHGASADLWAGILVDLQSLWPGFSAACAAPHYSEFRDRRAA